MSLGLSLGNRLGLGRGGLLNPYLLNLNFLDPAQYEPGGWLRDNFSRSSTATRTNSSGLIESVAIDVPRLQHDKDGNALGYLHEPQATNFLNDFTLASPSLSLRVTNAESSLDSPVVGQKWRDLILTGDTGAHRIGRDFNGTTGGEYTGSFYVKGAGARYVSIPIYPVNGSFAGAVFDLQAGTVTQELGGATGDIEATSDGYRISATATTDGGLPNQAGLCICNSGTPGTVTPSFTGDGTSGIRFTAGQAEGGSKATSVIPTSGAAATRQADTFAEKAINIPAGQWAIIYNTTPLAPPENLHYMLNLAGPSSPSLNMFRLQSGLVRIGEGTDATVVDVNQSINAVTPYGERHSIGVSINSTGGYRVVVDGSLVNEFLTTTMAEAPHLDSFRFDDGSLIRAQIVESVRIYRRDILTDELETLTAP